MSVNDIYERFLLLDRDDKATVAYLMFGLFEAIEEDSELIDVAIMQLDRAVRAYGNSEREVANG